MSFLIQLLIGKELARSGGITSGSEQLKIGVLSAAVSPPMLGLVLAKVATDRSRAPQLVKPPEPSKPVDETPVDSGKRRTASG